MIVGLTSEEARKRLVQFGPNVLVGGARVRPLKIFLFQFRGFLVAILILAAVFSLFVGESLDAIVILAIVVLNAVFGFIQEYRAENAIAALRRMVVNRVRVIRDGQETEINAEELVPGDVFLLGVGQKIPADANLLEAVNLTINEASITGESAPVTKRSQGKDDEGLVFMGTVVNSGRGLGEVRQTGMRTKFGRIASLISEVKEEATPLQKDLTRLGGTIIGIGIFAALAIFVIGELRGNPLVETLLAAISLAVAIVPEGLPAIVTITLGLGVQRMARKNVIIRRLSSIETFGSTDVICTDKTGTLTKNEMIVKKVFLDGKVYEEAALRPEKNNKFAQILRTGVLANTASLVEEAGGFKVLGDSTEGALLLLAKEHGVDYRKEREKGKLFREFSFDQRLKRMTVVWDTPGVGYEIFTKSAPEILLEISTLSAKEKKEIKDEIDTLASQGFRLLGFGYRRVGTEEPSHSITREEAERDLEYLGFVAIYDPPREGVKEAIKLAHQAGIGVRMITGDSPFTARAIGQEVGLFATEDQVIEGPAIEQLTDKELREVVDRIKIFARVSPEHKIRIVKAYKELGKVVAVTGDGVNDAPALKQADVGMAMGITGTDVAKESADAVLADDNFVSVVAAIEQGRLIYCNILKSIRYLLGCNFGELLTVLGAVALGFPVPLTPIQILWMNLVTDGLPALALSEDPGDHNVMDEPPRKKGVPVLDLLGKRWLIAVGLGLGAAALVTFILLDFVSLAEARTATFTVFVVGEMVAALAVRKGERLFSNPLLWVSILLSLGLQALILTVPSLQRIFDTVPFW
uniref:Cation-translocating P-type ATPase n=1 Tax=candidate division WWE3 bacterium TaxID=2053526 RepID=A0A831Z258_UNCKA